MSIWILIWSKVSIIVISFFHSGNAYQTVKSKESVHLITIRGTAFAPAEMHDTAAPSEAVKTEVKNDLSSYIGAELSKSDRPELTSAKTVISGGEFHRNQLFYPLKRGLHMKLFEWLSENCWNFPLQPIETKSFRVFKEPTIHVRSLKCSWNL